MARNFITSFRGDGLSVTPNGKFESKMRIKNEPITPIKPEIFEGRVDDIKFEPPSPDSDGTLARMSLSMNDITALREDMELNLSITSDKNKVYERYTRPPHTPPEMSRDKFVSMAEAIYHFQRDTPSRFHTLRPQAFKSQGGPSYLATTVPQSPALRCKGRTRAVHVLSQKEKEEKELEEIRKHKIKANPIPKCVFEGSKNLPNVPRKNKTVPEPFNLTEVKKKDVQEVPEQYVFQARPAPRHILDKVLVTKKTTAVTTKPASPKFRAMRALSNDNLHGMATAVKKPLSRQEGPGIIFSSVKLEVPHTGVPLARRIQTLRPVPFSFETRNEELRRQKEERIKKVIEEEKRQANQFKANPLPQNIKKKMQELTSKQSASSTSSDNKENHVKFEARPAKVLYKKPFVPVRGVLHPTNPAPFNLNLEKRASERSTFDQHLKEKEEEMERLKRQHELESKVLEEQEISRIRANLVRRAHPMPVFAPFQPEKSDIPITVPETPKFIRRMKQNATVKRL